MVTFYIFIIWSVYGSKKFKKSKETDVTNPIDFYGFVKKCLKITYYLDQNLKTSLNIEIAKCLW